MMNQKSQPKGIPPDSLKHHPALSGRRPIVIQPYAPSQGTGPYPPPPVPQIEKPKDEG